MTGIFEVFLNGKKVKDIENFNEFIELIEYFFFDKINKNDSILIRCEFPP